MYTFGDRYLAARVPAGLVQYQKDAFVLAGSHLLLSEVPKRAIENSSLFTVGSISQYTSPLVGRTKP